MQTKLTLRMDSELVQSAKRYAKQRGKSLSQMTAEYFSLLSVQEDEGVGVGNEAVEELPPITRFLRGLLSESDVSIEDYRKFLEDKYL